MLLEDLRWTDDEMTAWPADDEPPSSPPPAVAECADAGDRDDTNADSALFERFLDLRGRARGPVACVNGRFLFMNPGAAGLVTYGDRDHLWTWARGTIERGDTAPGTLTMPGRVLEARCVPIFLGAGVAGAEIRLADTAPQAAGASLPPSKRASSGWASLRESELGIAQLVAEGLTNREVGARLFLSRHTIDFHLRQIYRKLAISSRVELTRLVLQHAAITHSGALRNDIELAG